MLRSGLTDSVDKRIETWNPEILTAAGSDAVRALPGCKFWILKLRKWCKREPLLHAGAQTMLNLWLLAAGAFALAAVALARRARRRASDVSVQSVSEEWLQDLRGQRHEGP